VDAPQEKDRPTAYECVAQAVAGVLTWPLELLEPIAPRVGAAAQATDEFKKLEALALERARKGLALPREIYKVPYRDRIDWSRLPEWARPVDPEVFQGCGHEG
jgi:hypothetical protein